MRITTAAVPCCPEDVGIDYPFSGQAIQCRSGRVVIEAQPYEVEPLTIEPSPGETEIWLVFDGETVQYRAATPGLQDPVAELGVLGIKPVARLALVKIAPDQTMGEAEGQIVNLEPMIEERLVQRRGADGQLRWIVWERVERDIVESDLHRKYDLKAEPGRYRIEPVTQLERHAVIARDGRAPSHVRLPAP